MRLEVNIKITPITNNFMFDSSIGSSEAITIYSSPVLECENQLKDWAKKIIKLRWNRLIKV